MKRFRLGLLLAVFAAGAAAVLFGGVFRESSSADARAPVSRAAAEAFDTSFSPNRNTATLILDLQERLRANPQDGRSYVLLGLAYQQRARETGDSTYYPKSEGALRRALALDRKDQLALSGLASLALARHRFSEALRLAQRARDLAPWSARNYGAIGDALVELGRYREAFRAFDRMAHLRPSLSSYVRISYARELLGRYDEAAAAMKLAVDSAIGAPEPIAWTHVQLGKLYWNRGRLDAAAREYRFALAVFPGYAYALDALAQVEAARGRFARAIALERRAVDAVPLPQYVAFLGDLYRVTGRERLARQQYALIGAIERLLQANGVETDLEIALFLVDHGVDLHRAVGLARRAHAERPSIDSDDTLAWALARTDRCGEARHYSKRALRLGTQDALKFFHRGMIEYCLGHQDPARQWLRRSLILNPHFSVLWAPVARQTLRVLERRS